MAKRCEGQCQIIRYADDFVCLFQRKSDSVAFYEQLPTRLKKFNLEVALEKTNLLNFSKYRTPQENETFVFLGFEFRREISRKGKPFVSTKTAPKKLQKKIAEFKDWIKENRNQKLYLLMATVRRKFKGHYNYYGLNGNMKRMNKNYHWCHRALFFWLNRRSQRKSYNWAGFRQMLNYYKIPYPKVPIRGKESKKEEPRQLTFKFD